MSTEVVELRARVAELEAERDEALAKIAALREHTLDSNPALRQLHSQAVAYYDAVVALQKVRGGAPLSTSLAWLIEQGYLVPADPDAAAVRADERDRLAGAKQRADTAAGLVESMCHWRFDPHDMRAPGDQHDAFHFGDKPGQTGVCPYEAMAAVLRGEPDPRLAALSSRPVQPESEQR